MEAAGITARSAALCCNGAVEVEKTGPTSGPRWSAAECDAGDTQAQGEGCASWAAALRLGWRRSAMLPAGKERWVLGCARAF